MRWNSRNTALTSGKEYGIRFLKKQRLQYCYSIEDIERFAEKYEINAGGIAVAVRNVEHAFPENTGDKKEITGFTEAVLQSHLKILNQGTLRQKDCTTPGGEYTLDGLNIPGGELQTTLTILDRFNCLWSEMADNPEILNMNLLLYGPPGSGKTEFAKYISRRLKRRLLIRQASDLPDMYVGGTEKLMDIIFEKQCKQLLT